MLVTALRESQIMERERKAKLQVERQMEERQKKVEEQRKKEEQKRLAAEEKRKQKQEEEKVPEMWLRWSLDIFDAVLVNFIDPNIHRETGLWWQHFVC